MLERIKREQKLTKHFGKEKKSLITHFWGKNGGKIIVAKQMCGKKNNLGKKSGLNFFSAKKKLSANLFFERKKMQFLLLCNHYFL